MELLQISQLGSPVLRQIAQPIDNVHAEWVQTLIEQMLATLHHSKGVGLAAPQVAASYQLLIVASHPNARYPNAPYMQPIAMINPRIISYSDVAVKDWEGCLSVPGMRGSVPRFQAIEIEYTDRSGNLQQQELSDFVARIFQHELDHLNGMVFLDRLDGGQDLIAEQEYLKRLGQSPTG